MPFLEADGTTWSKVGCLREKGHEPPCSLEGTGDFTYRDPPRHEGPMLLMRQEQPSSPFRATCHRCGRVYMAVFSSLAPQSVAAVENAATVERP